MSSGRPHPERGANAQRGFTLIVGLLMLLVMSVLSIAMFRSFGLQERIAGNTREKQRAIAAAQSALQYGEWWLRLGLAGTGKTCTGNVVIDANTPSAMVACSNALLTPATLPWTYRAEFLPASMTVATGGGVAESGDINYQSKPGLYINYLGLTPDGRATVYQVSAYGYGGSSTTAAVVQSTYELQSSAKSLDGP